MRDTNRGARMGSLGATVLLVAALVAAGIAADDPIRWQNGVSLRERMEKSIGPVGYSWTGASLRFALDSLSRTDDVRVAMFLDRRIDPDYKLTTAIAERPFQEALEEIAKVAGVGVSQIGPVVYFGPSATTGRLRTLVALRREDARRLPNAIERAYTRLKPCKWEELATPRDLVTELATEASAQVAALELIPHDLWAGVDLPSLSLSDRLTLVLAGFDLTFSIEDDGATIRIVRMPAEVAINRRYSGGTNAADRAEQLAKAVPGAEVSTAGSQVVVRATAEDHEIVADLVAGKTVKRETTVPAKPVDQVPLEQVQIDKYAGTLEAGAMIRDLAKRLKIEVTFDSDAIAKAGISLTKPVTVEVKKPTTVRDLFKEVTGKAGLTFELKDRKLRIMPAAKK
jgi:hypothetical protein